MTDTDPVYSSESTDDFRRALRIGSGTRAWLGGNNVEVRRQLEGTLVGVERPPTGTIDAAIIAPASAEEAMYFAQKVQERLSPNATICVAYEHVGSEECSTEHNANAATAADLAIDGWAVSRRICVEQGYAAIIYDRI